MLEIKKNNIHGRKKDHTQGKALKPGPIFFTGDFVHQAKKKLSKHHVQHAGVHGDSDRARYKEINRWPPLHYHVIANN
jgi:hypothetical protein